MGAGGNVKIYNGTNYDLVKGENNQSHMSKWDPPDVPAGQAWGFYFEYGYTFFDYTTASGDSYYSLANTNVHLHLMAREKYNRDHDGNELWTQFSSSWNEPDGPLKPPYLIFWSSSDPTWKFMTSDERIMAHRFSNGDDWDGNILKIVQISKYVADSHEASRLASMVGNREFNNTEWTTFITTVEQQLLQMG